MIAIVKDDLSEVLEILKRLHDQAYAVVAETGNMPNALEALEAAYAEVAELQGRCLAQGLSHQIAARAYTQECVSRRLCSESASCNTDALDAQSAESKLMRARRSFSVAVSEAVVAASTRLASP